MEIIYMWIDDYKNIKDKEFNFSSNYNLKLRRDSFEKKERDSEDRFIIENRVPINPLPNNFFGKNITNITAIVGKNGSGKSNLLNALRIIKDSNYLNIIGKCLIIIRIGEQLKIAKLNGIKVKGGNINLEKVAPEEIKLKIISYSNTLEKEDFYGGNGNYKNLNSDYILSILSQRSDIKNSFEEYLERDNELQVTFFMENQKA